MIQAGAAGKPHVFVTRVVPEAGLALLRDACVMDVWEDELPPPRETLLRAAREADGLLTLLTDRVDAELMDASPALRVVSNFAVGYDNIDLPAATARGILVGNTPGALTETTADLAFALLLAAARRLPESRDYVRAGRWRTWGPQLLLGADVHGATLGLIGLGRIGRAVARRARGFEMRVVYTAPRRQVEAEERLGLAFLPLDELLAASDFVSLHAPLTPETRHLLDRDRLRRMKPGAFLINTARGPLVETDALVEALGAGVIAGAALDVTDPEPLPADHPLLMAPNCLVTPHIGSASVATRGAMAEIAARNLLAGLFGNQAPSPLNPEAARVGRSAAARRWEG